MRDYMTDTSINLMRNCDKKFDIKDKRQPLVCEARARDSEGGRSREAVILRVPTKGKSASALSKRTPSAGAARARD
jgi:hypothetical protein